MNKLVSSLAESIDSNIDKASLLLRLNHWNKEKVIELYFSDTEKFLNKLGLNKLDYCDGIDSDLNNNNSSEIECSICDETCLYNNSYSVDGIHRFCRNCYSDYLLSHHFYEYF